MDLHRLITKDSINMWLTTNIPSNLLGGIYTRLLDYKWAKKLIFMFLLLH